MYIGHIHYYKYTNIHVYITSTQISSTSYIHRFTYNVSKTCFVSFITPTKQLPQGKSHGFFSRTEAPHRKEVLECQSQGGSTPGELNKWGGGVHLNPGPLNNWCPLHTPKNEQLEPNNFPIEKEHHLPSRFRYWGVVGCSLDVVGWPLNMMWCP